jgi:hypothetical protein
LKILLRDALREKPLNSRASMAEERERKEKRIISQRPRHHCHRIRLPQNPPVMGRKSFQCGRKGK